jgi:hypothetical protein
MDGNPQTEDVLGDTRRIFCSATSQEKASLPDWALDIKVSLGKKESPSFRCKAGGEKG